ncbi:MAG: outer membrane beta-barrel protein [Bacteroidales bacterium]|nr:outer membrane beta-barrel protein [Bacteroidales bacterium]
MKTRILSILVLVFISFMSLSDLSAQKVRIPQIELYLSINYTTVNSSQKTAPFDGYKGLPDLGFGLKYYFFASKRFNLISGLEYNQYRFNFENMVYSHYGYLHDVTYYLKRFTLPLALRYNWGNKIKISAQAGVFGEVEIDTQKETYPNQFPYFDENNPGEKVKTGVGAGGDYGYHMGLGASIPISKFRINLLLEYRHGLNQLNDNYEEFKLNVMRVNLGFVF